MEHKLTIPLEELLERSKRVRSGKFITHEEAMKKLKEVTGEINEQNK